MKYNNISSRMMFVYVFFHIISLFVIVMGWLTNNALTDNIAMTVSLTLGMVMLNIVYFVLQDLFYFSYITEEEIHQRFLNKKKNILYSEVQCLFFIDNLLILSSNNNSNIQSGVYSISDKKMIKKQLKRNLVIWIDLSNKFFSKFVMEKCKNAKVIKVGKISKYIENEFNI